MVSLPHTQMVPIYKVWLFYIQIEKTFSRDECLREQNSIFL